MRLFPESFTKAFIEEIALLASATATPPLEFQKNSVAIRISDDMALGLGLREPTRDEAAQLAADRERWRTEAARREVVMAAALEALAAIIEPAAASVIELHAPEGDRYPTCSGCDFSGYEAEPPEWPCRTIETIAAHHGIELPR